MLIVKRQTIVELSVLVLLVAAGAATRVLFRDIPNFAPIAAMSLFAGYYFRSGLWAVCVPLAAMTISDLFIGGYEWQMMLVVYGMLALPVVARGVLRRFLKLHQGRLRDTGAALAGLLGCSVAASVLFFLTTNFAWWPWTAMYSHDAAGLAECFAAGLPFFRYTLLGDLFYATVLFGGYAAAVQLGWAAEPATSTNAAVAA